MNICTRCGKEFPYRPAMSRHDGSDLCRVCSAAEALEAVGVDGEEKEGVLAVIRARENG